MTADNRQLYLQGGRKREEEAAVDDDLVIDSLEDKFISRSQTVVLCVVQQESQS